MNQKKGNGPQSTVPLRDEEDEREMAMGFDKIEATSHLDKNSFKGAGGIEWKAKMRGNSHNDFKKCSWKGEQRNSVVSRKIFLKIIS